MKKEYPPRPEEPFSLPDRDICECGHNEFEHKTSDCVLLSNPPQYDYLECRKCMCPKYKFDHSEEIHLPR